MDGAVDDAGIEADVLHDVDLAVVGPAALRVLAAHRQHPDCRPRAAPARQLRAHFDPAVSPPCAGIQPRRGVLPALPVLASRFDDQPAVLRPARSHGARRCRTAARDCPSRGRPLRTTTCRIGKAWRVELVRPDGLPRQLSQPATLGLQRRSWRACVSFPAATEMAVNATATQRLVRITKPLVIPEPTAPHAAFRLKPEGRGCRQSDESPHAAFRLKPEATSRSIESPSALSSILVHRRAAGIARVRGRPGPVTTSACPDRARR